MLTRFSVLTVCLGVIGLGGSLYYLITHGRSESIPRERPKPVFSEEGPDLQHVNPPSSGQQSPNVLAPSQSRSLFPQGSTILGSYARRGPGPTLREEDYNEERSEILIDRLKKARDPLLKVRALEQLGRLAPTEEIVQAAANALGEYDLEVRQTAARVLLEFGDPSVVPLLEDRLKQEVPLEFALAAEEVIEGLAEEYQAWKLAAGLN